mgnify:CR=1 FL=1
MGLMPLVTVNLGSAAVQCRAVPVDLGQGNPKGFFIAYSGTFDVDPWVEMFYFPADTLTLAVFTAAGEMLWRRDLGPAVVPGMWFCPICACDLDGDGVDELWFVNNVNTLHPLGRSGYRLERVDALTGKTTGQWKWPLWPEGTLSHTFRNFILAGNVRGNPVLVTAQGTYRDMHLQGWKADMTPRWQYDIASDAPGARGAHRNPVVDINDDGVDELLWGERCIELDAGRELFCADRETYRGHSDVIEPLRDPSTGKWFIFTAREGDPSVSPRVVLFDSTGRRVWGDVDSGHMDIGWVARLGEGGEFVASAIRIRYKTCGPDGRHHHDVKEFVYEAMTGRRLSLPYPVYRTIPVDLNGDNRDELVYGIPGGDGTVIDCFGLPLGSVEATVAAHGSFCDLPGEQALTYTEDGTLRVWTAVS